ncbi:hypothetical protein KC325_g46 [Hortaea werneckii]|nr:hypothetical protein KC325_g46 [Hortaea werneckii]
MSSSRRIVLIDRLPERLISGGRILLPRPATSCMANRAASVQRTKDHQYSSGTVLMETQQPSIYPISRGIQVCQGLLSHYSYWKYSDPHIFAAISKLSDTLTLLKSTLEGDDLDRSRAERATKCLQSCEDAIQKLEADWGSARNSPPALRKEVLQEIRGNIVELQGHSSFALQVLHSVLVQQSEEYRKIVAWLSAPDPWTNHNSARRGHEDSTVNWLLQSHEYQKWKSSTGDHVWIHGSPGCGKTVLCSTVVEDIRDYCQQSPNTAYAIFYFTFSDIYKQASEYLIRSLVAQLGWREPGYSMLRKAYETSHRGVPMSSDELKGILLACIQSFKTVFLLLDALDECPEEHDCQEDVLKQIGILTSSAPNLKTFATSRGHPKIRHSMDELGFKSLEIVERKVDTDIQTYVSMQLSHDDRFSKLDPATLDMIETTISEQADGIFRYAYCQIQELKKLKSSRPNDIRLALKALPRAVDEMHTRLLQDIEERYQQEAFTLLEWLAYARSPLTLGELAEAVFIHADEESCVDAGNRGDIEDVLNLLSGLVVFEDSLKEAATRLPRLSSINIDEPITGPAKPQVLIQNTELSKNTRIRLAHFSLKEYLQSESILHSRAKRFHLVGEVGHRVLAQSCLAYLRHYISSGSKTSTTSDFEYFPLLNYAARSWYYHSARQPHDEIQRELSLLRQDEERNGWLFIHDPDKPWHVPFRRTPPSGSAIYYAALLGIRSVVKHLLQCGVDVNVQGGYYGNALQAASSAGHLEAIQLLLVGGADVNAEGGHFGSALQAASSAGHIEAMQLLLVGGADVNARSGEHRNAIQAASYGGYTKAIQLLLDCGADVNAHGGKYGNALYTASERGHKEALHLLLEKGANVNSQGGKYGNPLQAASVRGDMEVVQSLLHRGADPRATGGIYSTALHAASSQAFPDIVRLLLRYGADVEARSESLETPLQVACVTGATEMATLLLDFGANPNAAPGSHGTCLRAAALSGADEIVRRLLSHGVELSEDIPQNDVLFVASRAGNEGILCMLLKNGVSPNTSALKKASEEGHEQVVDLLVLAGAVASTQNQEQTKSSLPRTSRYTEQQIPDTSDDDSDMQTHGESVFSGKKLSVATLPTTLSSHLHQEVIQRQTISATEESAEPEDAPVRLESLRHESADSSHMPSARSFNNRDLGNTDPTKDAHEDVKHEVTAEEPTGAVKKSVSLGTALPHRVVSTFRRRFSGQTSHDNDMGLRTTHLVEVANMPICSKRIDEKAVCRDETQPDVADGDVGIGEQFFTPKHFVFRGTSKLHQAAVHWCRPRLSKGFSRLEWSCSCGQSFWGDFQHTKRQDLDRLISDFRRNGLQVRIVAAYGATAMHGDNARPQDINLPSGLSPCGLNNVTKATKAKA